MGQARCFSCLTPHEQLQAQTYLFAKIAGFDTSAAGVAALQAASACFSCLTRIQLMRLKAYLIATWLGLDTSLAGIQAQVKAAACQTCLTPRQQLQVQTYLLAVSAGLATDKAGVVSIEAAAKCFDCPTTKAQYEIQVYILAGLANVASITPSDLMAAAKCFESCLVPEIEDALLNSLITQSANRSTPPCITPTAPVSSAGAKSIGNTSFRIVWSQPANTGSLITSYTIKWGTVSGVYPNSVTIPVIPRVYDLTGLASGTQYFWVVVANSFTGCSSANSNEGTATTTGASTANGLLNNLISYWRFNVDRAAGQTTLDSQGAHDLTLTNVGITAGPFFCDTGILGEGALCIGAGGTFAGATGGGDFALGLGVSFAISCWIKGTWDAPVSMLISEYDNNNIANGAFWLDKNNVPPVTLQINLRDTGGNIITISAPGAPPANGVWHHCVFGFDATVKQGYLYFNNGPRQSLGTVTNGIASVATDFHIGVCVNNPFPAFTNGRVSEVGFWKNRILSAADVSNLYNGGAGLSYTLFTH